MGSLCSLRNLQLDSILIRLIGLSVSELLGRGYDTDTIILSSISSPIVAVFDCYKLLTMKGGEALMALNPAKSNWVSNQSH